MAIPKKTAVLKRNWQKKQWQREDKVSDKKEEISPEEHEERVKKLKELGLIK